MRLLATLAGLGFLLAGGHSLILIADGLFHGVSIGGAVFFVMIYVAFGVLMTWGGVLIIRGAWWGR
jgi:hypothetical protein